MPFLRTIGPFRGEVGMRGYVYVMVNSSLPGLVKIGKTTRSVSERVVELSAATGVPTPFIVAFEQAFEDCDAAEDFIHATLEQRGLRAAANREFFRATPGDAIRVVMTAPNSISPDELGAIGAFEQPESASPAEGLWVEGACYEYGLDGHLQDYRKAFSLYTQAARLGSAKAYDSLASMTEEGNGTPADSERALEFRRKSGELGNYFAYGTLMLNYANRGHEHNFQTCMAKMLELRRIHLQSKSELFGEEYEVISSLRYY
jgi:hypothetical protein